jgi:hypothetical protein
MTSAPHDATAGATPAGKSPNALAILFNFPKTLSLVKSVFQDARVHWMPKIVFSLSLIVLLVALFVPEIFAEIVGAFSVIGLPLDLLGIPVDGTIDWIVAAVAAFNLLRLFPSQVVDEHYDRIFSKHDKNAAPERPTGTRVVDAD